MQPRTGTDKVATLQDAGDSFGFGSSQVEQQVDLAAVVQLALGLQSQLATCMAEKVQLQAELASERAIRAEVQFQSDQFAELATHFALVGCAALFPSN